MSTEERGTSLSGAHSAIAMVQTWTKHDPCAHGVFAMYLHSLLLRKRDVFHAEQKSHDLAFMSSSGLKRTVCPDAGWWSLLVPDVLIQHSWATALVWFQEKRHLPA